MMETAEGRAREARRAVGGRAPVGDQKRVPKGLKGLVAGTITKPSVFCVMPSGSR